MKKLNRIPEWLVVACAGMYYLLLSLYKLLEAALWGDEVVEYYCALFTTGAIPGITEAATMYARNLEMQQQPPLYSLALGLWVLISNSEFWIRFSSVAFCFGAVAALYLIMRKLTNRWFAALSVILFSSMYQVQYYVKEAAEYALLLPLIFWTIYCFICILEKITAKRILAFTLLCVASIYTQYGAAFIIVPMALQVLYHCFRSKEKKLVGTALGSYLGAAVVGGIPLIILFLIPQSANPVSTFREETVLEFEKNIVYDFFLGFTRLLDWQLLNYDRDGARMMPLMWLLAAAFILSGIWLVIKKVDRVLSNLLFTCLLTYILYYICVKLKIYSYGWFGLRYCLFFLPLILTVMLYMLWIILRELSGRMGKKAFAVLKEAVLLIVLAYCCYGVYRVHNHWWKSDERAVVSYWYDHNCKEELTFVDYKQRITFTYYLEQNKEFDSSYWDNLYVNMNMESTQYTVEEWEEYLVNEVWGEGMPDRLYISTGYYNNLIIAMESLGYQAETALSTTTDFYYLTRQQ